LARYTNLGVRHSPYLIVYRLDSDNKEVLVLGVFHGGQNWQARDH
jgi:plasmid stabilization system protein ParE